MPRKAAMILIAFLFASTGLLAARAGRTRESLLPLMRTGQDHVKQVERAAALGMPVDAAAERELGREIGRICAHGAVRDARLEEIAARLERSGMVKRFAGRYEYRVIPGRGVYAFAAPGGFVYVSQGLLDAMEHDPDRIAFVLGHEIAHAELGHTADRVRYKAWLTKWRLPGANIGQALRELAALSFAPGQELEADAFAFEMMRRCDYRLEASVEFFARLARGSSEEAGTHRRPDEFLAEALVDYFRTHPGERERVERLRGKIGAPPPAVPSSPVVVRSSAAYTPPVSAAEDFFTGR
ncbi:MAG: M48 family metallopeptidase [Elusimicrobiota bacterium]